MKIQPTKWEKIFGHHVFDPVSRIKTSYFSTTKRQHNLKMGKGYEQPLQRRYANGQRAHTHKKRSMSLATRNANQTHMSYQLHAH